MHPMTWRTLTLAIASSMVIAACSRSDDGGDGGGDADYNAYGQPIEKTDVRVVGVDLCRAADGAGRITDRAETFAPTDTVYASVRTEGSSSHTILGVRWKNAQ